MYWCCILFVDDSDMEDETITDVNPELISAVREALGEALDDDEDKVCLQFVVCVLVLFICQSTIQQQQPSCKRSTH